MWGWVIDRHGTNLSRGKDKQQYKVVIKKNKNRRLNKVANEEKDRKNVDMASKKEDQNCNLNMRGSRHIMHNQGSPRDYRRYLSRELNQQG